MNQVHLPVLLAEVMGLLRCASGGVYVDCTVGTGGHAREIMRRAGPGGRLIGLDVDAEALRLARARLEDAGGRFDLVQASYTRMAEVARGLGVGEVDGVLFDLGVSSHQLADAGRGFSYLVDAPLDMRFDRGSGRTAADLVNELPREELARVIAMYGEERWASRIAEFVVRARAARPIRTTGELLRIVKEAIPAGARRRGPHPARRTFQALRIAVNGELEGLAAAIRQAVALTRPGGRVCLISYHSLEDRIVKRTFTALAGVCSCPADLPVCVCGKKQWVRIVTRKPVVPRAEEISDNPRSRSARLRAAERVSGGVLNGERGE